MANDNRYNEERENATFAVNLRKLFEDKKATHNELACFLKEKTGDSITRQAVGQWCNGNSSPNLKTVPVIAEFFGVSSDYLLGMSDVKSTNVELRAVCEFTGLTGEAAETLNLINRTDKEVLDTVNYLLEQYAEAGNGYIDGKHHSGAFWFKKIRNVLSDISRYLRITAQEDKNKYCIMENGSIMCIDPENNPYEGTAGSSIIRAMLESQDIDNAAIVESVLWNNLEYALKTAKEKYTEIKNEEQSKSE